MQLNDVLKEFVFENETSKKSEKTIKSYRNNNQRFFNFIESEYKITELEDIIPLHIRQYIQFLMKKDLKESYVNSILKSIRAFFAYCMKEEYLTQNPASKVLWQKEEKPLIVSFTDEEVFNLLNSYNFSNYLNARNKTIIAFLIDTGVRNSELCNLRNKDIEDMTISILGKGRKIRQVAITPLLKKYMIKYERIKEFYFKDKILKHTNYFLSNTGLPLTVETLERVVKKAGDVAGVRKEVRCSPHTARHTFAQMQLKNGLDVYSLSRLLGHENIMITKRYLQSIQDKDIVAISVKTSPLMNLK